MQTLYKKKKKNKRKEKYNIFKILFDKGKKKKKNSKLSHFNGK